MVDTRSDSGETTYIVINNPNDIETYTKFDLWLYPDDKFFERLEVDTPQTLKFRKQNYYNLSSIKDFRGSWEPETRPYFRQSLAASVSVSFPNTYKQSTLRRY